MERTKGVEKYVFRTRIQHEDYVNTLEQQKRSLINMKAIRSDYHQINMYGINKIGLSMYDDKRFIKDDGIATLAYGHADINIL